MEFHKSNPTLEGLLGDAFLLFKVRKRDTGRLLGERKDAYPDDEQALSVLSYFSLENPSKYTNGLVFFKDFVTPHRAMFVPIDPIIANERAVMEVIETIKHAYDGQPFPELFSDGSLDLRDLEVVLNDPLYGITGDSSRVTVLEEFGPVLFFTSTFGL